MEDNLHLHCNWHTHFQLVHQLLDHRKYIVEAISGITKQTLWSMKLYVNG